jgi:hypothetical protein
MKLTCKKTGTEWLTVKKLKTRTHVQIKTGAGQQWLGVMLDEAQVRTLLKLLRVK